MAFGSDVICIVGPTASGKSKLSIELAERIGGKIVSADSMQVYRGMDIGTAKVPPSERKVEHYGLDLVDPGEPYSAALFQEYARECFAKIDDDGFRPVICGGTGFYVRAAIDDYRFPEGEQVGNSVRDMYNDMLDSKGPVAVWEELESKDPDSAHAIHPNDSKRVIRALEMLDSGESYANQLKQLHSIQQKVPAMLIGIDVNRDELNARIEKRVDEMRDQGLVEEVEGLIERGFREGVTAQHAIGYKEVAFALDGKMSMDEAFESIKTATRRYAKRQRTWFRGDARIRWIDGSSGDIEHMLEQTMRVLAADR